MCQRCGAVSRSVNVPRERELRLECKLLAAREGHRKLRLLHLFACANYLAWSLTIRRNLMREMGQ
jgi:hypothetical protein